MDTRERDTPRTLFQKIAFVIEAIILFGVIGLVGLIAFVATYLGVLIIPDGDSPAYGLAEYAATVVGMGVAGSLSWLSWRGIKNGSIPM